jgi:hypothetical protein
MMQNGSHPIPPVDPIHHALEQLQQNLSDLVSGWHAAAQKLNLHAEKEVFVVTTTHEAQPEVSILPVDPTGEPGSFDAGQVVIGKSPEQVEQAIRDAPPLHEEL